MRSFSPLFYFTVDLDGVARNEIGQVHAHLSRSSSSICVQVRSSKKFDAIELLL